MSAKLYALTADVREAKLDLKALRRNIGNAGARAYEWRPAEAYAERRIAELARVDNNKGSCN